MLSFTFRQNLRNNCWFVLLVRCIWFKWMLDNKLSAGTGSVLWGAYVTGCHWLSDLEGNSCSSGVMCFHWKPLIWKYKSKTNRDIEHCRCLTLKLFLFLSGLETWLGLWVTCCWSQFIVCINITSRRGTYSILYTEPANVLLTVGL